MIKSFFKDAAGEISHLRNIFNQNQKTRIIIISILAINIIFILIHILSILIKNYFDVEHEYFNFLRLDEDRSIPEFFNYSQSFASAFFLLKLYLGERKLIFAALSFSFLFIGFDDMLEIHEIFGHLLAQMLDFPPILGLRPRDSGELLVWLLIGAPLGLAIAWGLIRSDRRTRAFSILVLSALALLVFFAAGVDMLHIALPDLLLARGADPTLARGLYSFLTIVEDGGEMLSLALCLSIILLRLGAGRVEQPGRMPSKRA